MRAISKSLLFPRGLMLGMNFSDGRDGVGRSPGANVFADPIRADQAADVARPQQTGRIVRSSARAPLPKIRTETTKPGASRALLLVDAFVDFSISRPQGRW
jgi:hypothetical protein